MNIFHISDLHFNSDDPRGIANLSNILNCINSYKNSGDLLLVSGDIINRDFHDYQPVFQMLDTLNMPYLCATGNHDVSEALISALARFCPHHPKPLLPNKLDYICDDFPLKIITLDSFKANVPGGEISNSQFEFLIRELENTDKPIIIMIHQFTLNAGLFFFDKQNSAPCYQTFNQIIYRYQNKIKLVACGHLHNSLISHIGTVPVIASFSANWQAHLDFSPLPELKNPSRPVGFYLHRFDGKNLISFAMAL